MVEVTGQLLVTCFDQHDLFSEHTCLQSTASQQHNFAGSFISACISRLRAVLEMYCGIPGGLGLVAVG